MILIISSEDDRTTLNVQKWLAHFNEEYLVINESAKIVLNKYILSNALEEVELLINSYGIVDKIINLSDVGAVWYRRGTFKLNFQKYIDNNDGLDLELDLNKYLYKEIEIINSSIRRIFSEIGSINSEIDVKINKITALSVAKANGLDVPETFISSSVKNIHSYFKYRKNVITKPINNGFILTNNCEISGGTVKVVNTNLPNFENEYIFPSLFQENLEKEYELRIFFVFNEYYSSAIFSQSSKKTKVDFRNYDSKNQNRVVPYNLPKDIEFKLIKTMQDMNLNSGSIDMVVTKDNRFVFLEVNPIGQFEQVSQPCYYYLERRIAQLLIKMKNERKKVPANF